MAVLLDDVKIKLGRTIKVWNTKRKTFSNSKLSHIAIQIEDANGENERCILLTENELKNAEYRAKRNPEDLTKKSWWTDFND